MRQAQKFKQHKWTWIAQKWALEPVIKHKMILVSTKLHIGQSRKNSKKETYSGVRVCMNFIGRKRSIRSSSEDIVRCSILTTIVTGWLYVDISNIYWKLWGAWFKRSLITLITKREHSQTGDLKIGLVDITTRLLLWSHFYKELELGHHPQTLLILEQFKLPPN